MEQAHEQQSQGNVLGKFRLIAELGRGGMSEVYLAVVAGPAGFNKLTVVKLIKGDLAEDPEFISMFLEEARLSARLNHPNIVQTNEVGQHGSRYFISMEYLEGQPYSRIVNRLGRDRGLPIGMSLRIMSDVLTGLQYAHELRDFDGSRLEVVHRDVTPHNIFVTYDGQVKVVDFGIAKAMNSSHETRTGMLKGKVGYMAPEQARGERVDCRADVFSVGVMLWEAAVGRRMWKGLSEVQVLHQLVAGEIPRPRSMRPDISEQLESIIMRSLALDRNNRYASCADFQADLDELLEAGGERTTLREVGRRIGAAFDDERLKIKQIIEGQLARATLATGTYNQAQLPVFDRPMTGEHPSMLPQEYSQASYSPAQSLPSLGNHTGSNPSYQSGPQSMGSASHPGHSQHGSNPQLYQPQMPQQGYGMQGPSVPNVGPQGQVPSSYSHPHTGSIARSSLSSPTGSGPRMAAPKTTATQRLTLVALAIAAAASVLVLVLYVSVGRDKPKATNASATQKPSADAAAPTAATSEKSATASTTAPSASAPAASVAVTVVVKPKDATVFIDDVKATGFAGSVPKDGAQHKVRVEASGYATKSTDFTADRNDFTWEPEMVPTPHNNVPTPPNTQNDPNNGKFVPQPTSRPIETSYPGG